MVDRLKIIDECNYFEKRFTEKIKGLYEKKQEKTTI